MSMPASIGINLSPVNYWSTEYPFIDRMKTAGAWNVQGGSLSSVTFDNNGYPTSIPAGTASVWTMVALDPASAGTNKTYVLSYTGTATFRIPGATIVSTKPGEITFTVTGNTPMQNVLITSIDGKDPLTDMHIVRQDQMSLFKQGNIFNPAFLDKVSQFGTLRFMDWEMTNTSTVTSWSQRTTVSDYSWATTSSTTGVPIEVMVALANQTHTSMWLTIPTQADDNYARQMLTYVRDNLDPTLKVNVEYSNEVWNWGFSQSRYAMAMANKLWGVDANGDGVIDPNNPAEVPQGGWQQYYGYRAAQIAAIANDVFGANGADRLQNVLATQTAYLGLENYALIGVARAGVGSVSSLFGNYAVTTYFGSELSGQNAADRAVILGWAKSGSAGMDAAFDELANGGKLTGWGSLPSVMAQWAYQANIARKYGLNLVAYEGGVDFNAANFSAADQPVIMDFFARLSADPRMTAIYDKMIDAFSAAGGTLLNAYTDAQSDRTGGLFGTLKSIYDNATPAWSALVQRQADAVAAQKAAAPLDISTAMTSYALDAKARTLTFVGTGAFIGTGNALANVITGGNGGNKLYGGDGDDTLTGGNGDDYLDGGAGADTMTGGAGNDVYIVDNPGDKVVELPGGGTDEVRTTLSSYTLGANVENLTYTGTGAFTGTGNALANVITGGDGDDRLYGGDGNDTLTGGAGNDYLDGGSGADRMVGGAGNDTYVVDNPGDTVVEAANGGTDTVISSITYTLGANVENLTLSGSAAINGTGNDADNVIIGNAGNNVLSGGNGNDTLIGGGGNDTLIGGAGNDVLIAGTGRDTLTGGTGADRFVFGPGTLGRVMTNTDNITDFSSAEGDKIDLSQWDANSLTTKKDGFTFIGSKGFTRHAGELRVDSIGTTRIVSADTNGDGVADMVLVVKSPTALIQSDFILG